MRDFIEGFNEAVDELHEAYGHMFPKWVVVFTAIVGIPFGLLAVSLAGLSNLVTKIKEHFSKDEA